MENGVTNCDHFGSHTCSPYLAKNRNWSFDSLNGRPSRWGLPRNSCSYLLFRVIITQKLTCLYVSAITAFQHISSAAFIPQQPSLLPLPILFSPSPSLFPFPSLFFPYHPLNPARGLGERWAPPAGSGAKPQPKSNLVHFSLKYDIWWQQFYLFSWESTDQI